MDKVHDLKLGDIVTIKRTSGEEQEAQVYWLADKIGFKAPEVITFKVVFQVGNEQFRKACCQHDLVKLVKREEEQPIKSSLEQHVDNVNNAFLWENW